MSLGLKGLISGNAKSRQDIFPNRECSNRSYFLEVGVPHLLLIRLPTKNLLLRTTADH